MSGPGDIRPRSSGSARRPAGTAERPALLPVGTAFTCGFTVHVTSDTTMAYLCQSWRRMATGS